MVLAIVFTLFTSRTEHLPNLSEYRLARFETQAIGNQVFAFAMHGTLLTIYQDMRRPQDAEKMFDRVYLTGFLLKFIVGASGYFLFGMAVSDQITLDLPNPHMRVFITLAVTLKKWLTYALPLEPVARALEDAPFRLSRILSRSGLVLFTVLVALWLPHFGLMQSLIGSLCAGFLVLVFPVAFYLKIVPNHGKMDIMKYRVLLVVSSILVWFAAVASVREAVE
jgi:vesicular inhibitory amino acid transporter